MSVLTLQSRSHCKIGSPQRPTSLTLRLMGARVSRYEWLTIHLVPLFRVGPIQPSVPLLVHEKVREVNLFELEGHRLRERESGGGSGGWCLNGKGHRRRESGRESETAVRLEGAIQPHLILMAERHLMDAVVAKESAAFAQRGAA